VFPFRDSQPIARTPWITRAIVAFTAAVFLYQLSLDERRIHELFLACGIVPARWFDPGGSLDPRAVPADAWPLVTSMFLHGSLLHVVSNLWALWIFGDNIEDRLGHARFLMFYLACGAVAALSQAAMDPGSIIPMVGASGAIAGVMGGYFVLYPHSRVLTLFPFPIMIFEVPAIFFLGLWFFVQFLNGLGSLAAAAGELPGGVAFWAHVMGFVAGVMLVRVMRRPERERVEWWGA
jgi:membrane associated rhomboid family serine protease